MADVRFEGAPLLEGWVIGAAMGLVAFAASVVVGEFALMPAAFFGVVVAGAAGAVMGFPWWIGGPVSPASSAAFAARVAAADEARAAARAAQAPVAKLAPVAKVVAAPAEVEATPAALISTPVETAGGPARHAAPLNGKADTLRDIEGVGPVTERLLNQLGFWHFDQVANWTEADVAWVESNLRGFKGRVTRDKWVAQAKIIVTEGMASFRQRARRNDY